jgi:hypothetical protein
LHVRWRAALADNIDFGYVTSLPAATQQMMKKNEARETVDDAFSLPIVASAIGIGYNVPPPFLHSPVS